MKYTSNDKLYYYGMPIIFDIKELEVTLFLQYLNMASYGIYREVESSQMYIFSNLSFKGIGLKMLVADSILE